MLALLITSLMKLCILVSGIVIIFLLLKSNKFRSDSTGFFIFCTIISTIILFSIESGIIN